MLDSYHHARGEENFQLRAGHIDLRPGVQDSYVSGKRHPMHRRARPKVGRRLDPVGIIECSRGYSSRAGEAFRCP